MSPVCWLRISALKPYPLKKASELIGRTSESFPDEGKPPRHEAGSPARGPRPTLPGPPHLPFRTDVISVTRVMLFYDKGDKYEASTGHSCCCSPVGTCLGDVYGAGAVTGSSVPESLTLCGLKAALGWRGAAPHLCTQVTDASLLGWEALPTACRWHVGWHLESRHQSVTRCPLSPPDPSFPCSSVFL